TQSSPATIYRAYLYLNGAAAALPVPPDCDASSSASSIGPVDLIVGSCGNSAGTVFHQILWQGVANMALLDARYSLPINGVTGPPMGLSNEGQIIIYGGINSPQNHEVAFLLRPLPPMPGDATCDQHVNIDDLLAVVTSWGPCQYCPADFDQNGLIN